VYTQYYFSVVQENVEERVGIIKNGLAEEKLSVLYPSNVVENNTLQKLPNLNSTSL